MGRLLAIDYGKRRCGIAVTDTLRIVATGLATIPSSSLEKFLNDYFSKEQVDAIVMGYPTDMKGNPSESMAYITPVVNRLKKIFPSVEIVMWDERFTSTLAHKAMLESGMRKSRRQQKENADVMAATIILNDYLQSQQYKLK